jgi:hypothetical protein
MMKLLGLVAALGGIGAAVYSQAPEIRRYMKIRQM